MTVFEFGCPGNINCLCASRAFFFLVCVSFVPFISLLVSVLAAVVIMALPGLFYYSFEMENISENNFLPVL